MLNQPNLSNTSEQATRKSNWSAFWSGFYPVILIPACMALALYGPDRIEYFHNKFTDNQAIRKGVFRNQLPLVERLIYPIDNYMLSLEAKKGYDTVLSDKHIEVQERVLATAARDPEAIEVGHITSQAFVLAYLRDPMHDPTPKGK